MSMSPIILERNGWWRGAGMGAVMAVAALPFLPLVSEILSSDIKHCLITGSFIMLVFRSLATSITGGLLALLAGIMSGIFIAFYRIRFSSLFQIFLMLPLTVPSLLWAAGLKKLGFHALNGDAGIVFITAIQTFPLVMLMTAIASRSVSSGQRDAARMAGGEWKLVYMAAFRAMPSAIAAACIGACVMLASPGPGLAMGVKTAISEVLVSFSALYNTKLAIMQCLVLASVIMLIAAIAIRVYKKRPSETADLAAGPGPAYHETMSRLALLMVIADMAVFLAIPLGGLAVAALHKPDFSILAGILSETLPNTFLYAGASACLATLLGFFMAFFMGKSTDYTQTGTIMLLMIIVMPAVMNSLGILAGSSIMPEWMDFLARGPAAVWFAQGARLFPVPALLISTALKSIPASWSWSAELHNISFTRFMTRIIAPAIRRPAAAGFILSFLLAAADVETVLLLHPPGVSTLPLTIFTVMANSPGWMSGWLSLSYVMTAGCMLWLIYRITGKAI